MGAGPQWLGWHLREGTVRVGVVYHMMLLPRLLLLGGG